MTGSHRGLALAAVASVLLAGCSVSTPRHETVAAREERLQATAASETGETTEPVELIGEATAADAAVTTGPSTSKSTTAAAPAARGAATPAPARSSGAGASTSTAAPTTASAPGVTKDTVTVSIIAGFSGPLAAMVENAFAGLETWRDDVNDAGGIHGRKVQLKKVDHKETADGGVAACKEAVSNGTFFAAVPEGVEANLTAVDCLDAAGVPSLYFAPTTNPKWKLAFTNGATSSASGPILATLVKSKLGRQKVGVIYVNQAAYKALSDTFVPKAKAIGLSVVGTEAVEPNQASFTGQLLRLREAGAETVVVSATAEAVGVLRDARSMGWTPTFASYGATFDFLTVASRNLFEGVIGLRDSATVDTPAYEKYAARMEARGRGRARDADLEAFHAYGHALTIGRMLEAAGRNPTRQSLVAGTETIREFDSGVLPVLNFGPGKHVGTDAAFGVVCCNEDWTWKGQGPARSSF